MWRALERDAARVVFGVGLLDVVAREREPGEVADAIFMAGRREEDDAGFGCGNAQFDPALFAVERLVGGNREAEFLSVEFEGAVLIADGDAGELELGDYPAK